MSDKDETYNGWKNYPTWMPNPLQALEEAARAKRAADIHYRQVLRQTARELGQAELARLKGVSRQAIHQQVERSKRT